MAQREAKRGEGVKPNRIHEIDEAGALTVTPEPVAEVKPFFKDVSQMIAHRHHQEVYDDYARQPLLPFQLSQPGPGVAWINLFGDQREELVIGSGRGGQLGIYAPDGQGGLTNLPVASRLAEDMAGIVGWVGGSYQCALLFGRDNYESSHNNPSASAFGFVPTFWKQNLPETPASTGPLAVADIYGDGHLGLFVGGRVIPGRYPEAADSKIYRNIGGQLQLDEANSRVLEKVGLVNGAVWSDLDGTGYPDLILACEWGPIRVFKNTAGHLQEVTKELGLDKYTGWWRGVTTGDLDGDGRLDIIASNWGENSDYQASEEHPLRLYYGDFTDRGALSLIECVYDPLRGVEVPRRTRFALANAYPPLLGQFATHKAYAEATLEQVLAILPQPIQQVQASTLASTVFFNRTNRFEAVRLPYAAQIAPAFAVNVGDFDGDGNEDIFLSQNFFEMASGTVSMSQPGQNAGLRLDAGRGLWLRGTGGGRLEAVPGQKSGILVYGEQRGAALCDFNGDGRVRSGRQPERSGNQALPECAGQTRPARAAERITGQSRRIGSSSAVGLWKPAGSGSGNSRRFGLLVAGQRGPGDGLPGSPDPDPGALAGRQDHDERHSGRGTRNHGGHRRQADGESLRVR